MAFLGVSLNPVGATLAGIRNTDAEIHGGMRMGRLTLKLNTVTCFMCANSFVYGLVLSASHPQKTLVHDLWAVSHYIVLAVFFVIYTSLIDRSREVKNKVFFWANFVFAAFIILSGFFASTTVFLSWQFAFTLSLQVLLTAVIIFTSRNLLRSISYQESELSIAASTEKDDELAETVARYVMNTHSGDSKKRIFKSGFYALLCLIVLLVLCWILPLFVRHSDFADMNTFSVLGVLLALFMLLNEKKNKYFSEYLKNSFRTSLIEMTCCTVGLFGYYYLNGVVYKGTGFYPFHMFLLLGIAVTPFLITSKDIYKKYVETAKEL
ncbi:MAG: hypothetical protein LBC29_03800 [Propionibacteriaceae bacterium]|nr:hypothetical protein [Propionibacteriaceae bacterium]